jgi:type I restriction enzyme M protein
VTGLEPTLGLIVPKEKIVANGDCNLSGERYRDGAVSSSSFPLVALGEICELVRGVVFSKEDEVAEGGVQVLRANNINKDRYELNLEDIRRVSPKSDFSDEKKLRKGDIFICLASGSKDHVGKVALIESDTDYYFGGFMGAIRVKPGRLHPSYLLKQLTTGHFNDFLREQIAGANINNLSGGLLYRFNIPLPPLEVQEEIVAEIEGYQKVINGARAVLDSYRPRIPINPDWPMVELCEATSVTSGYSFRSKDFSPANSIRSIKISNVGVREFIEDNEGNLPTGFREKYPDYVIRTGDLVIALTRSIISTGLKVAVVPATYDSSLLNQRVASIRAKPEISDITFIYLSLGSEFTYKYIEEKARSLMQPNLSINDLKQLEIPLPPLSIQKAIVAEIETEQALVAANRELITRFEKKIQAALARIWAHEVADK